MRPKLGAITALKPRSVKAQTACSRELPQPKFSRATTAFASGWASSISFPPGIPRNKYSPKPVFEIPVEARRDDLIRIDIRTIDTQGPDLDYGLSSRCHRLRHHLLTGRDGFEIFRGADPAEDRARRHDGGRREMHAAAVPHPAGEVPIRRGDAA